MKQLRSGFTLIELLIVIGIIAVLATVTLLVLNPAQTIAQSRDATRFAESDTLKKIIQLFLVDRGSITRYPQQVFVSIPDPALSGNATSTCPNINLPPLSNGWTYVCTSPENVRNINGTGWLPLDLNTLSSGPPVARLPIDPVNNTQHYYSAILDNGYFVGVVPESQKFTAVATNDGGSDSATAESGSDINLWTTARASQPRITLAWDQATDTISMTNPSEPVTGVQGYRVYRRPDINGANNFGFLHATQQLLYTDTAVVAGVAYSYFVTAIDGGTPPNESVGSNQVTCQVNGSCPPLQP